MSDNNQILMDIHKAIGKLEQHAESQGDWMKAIDSNVGRLTESFNDHVNESEAFRAKVNDLDANTVSVDREIQKLTQFKEDTQRAHNRFYGFVLAMVLVAQLTFEKIGAGISNLLKTWSS